MNRPLRIAVIGVGYLGRFHAEKYAAMGNVELVGVVDVLEERAENIAGALGARSFTNYRDLVGQVDAVSVVTPTVLHHEISRFCLEHEIDVLIEKPMTETLEQADELIETAEARGRIIQVGHLERFNPAVVALQDVVKRPMFVESHRLAIFKPRGTDVDVVLDLMIHDIDIILSFVGSDLRDIHAAGVPVVSSHVDIANARLVFNSGCVANVTASRISIKNMRKIRIFQKDTYMSVDYANHEISVIRKDGRGKGIPLPIPGMTMERSTFGQADSLDAELKAFVESVRLRRPPLVSGHDGRRALRVALEIIKQIKTSTENARREQGEAFDAT